MSSSSNALHCTGVVMTDKKQLGFGGLTEIAYTFVSKGVCCYRMGQLSSFVYKCYGKKHVRKNFKTVEKTPLCWLEQFV